MSTHYQTSWVQQPAPELPSYTSGDIDHYGAFSGTLDSGINPNYQNPMFRPSAPPTLARTEGDMVDASGASAAEKFWWDTPSGTFGNWMPGEAYDSAEYDTDSTTGTNGQCTTPDNVWLPASAEDAHQQTSPYPGVGLQPPSNVGTYTQHLSAPQMPVPASFSVPKQEGLAVVVPSVAFGAGGPPGSVPGSALTTIGNGLMPKASSRTKREKPADVTGPAAKPKPKLPAPAPQLLSDGSCCPFCKATFAGGEAGAIPAQGHGGPRKKVKKDGSGGEEIRQRCFRNRKDVRQHNRQGKWWSSVGYDGAPYCQRCSEIFRDHIIRTMSNSANCSREHPCHDCEQILRCFTGGRDEAFKKMAARRSKSGAEHSGPYKRRKRAQR